MRTTVGEGATTWCGYDLVPNVSMLLAATPVLQRPAEIRRLGFERFETWWPFPSEEGSAGEQDAFAAAVVDAGVQLVAMNTFAGDPGAGDRGLGAVPGAAARFRRNLAQTLALGDRLGCRLFNVLLGSAPDSSPEETMEVAADNLAEAARRAEAQGATVLVEVLNDVDSPGYPVTSVARARTLIEEARTRSGTDAVGLLLDVYHLAVSGRDPHATLRGCADILRHVQLADHPGRGAPGTGLVDFDRLGATLRSIGYDGFVALEHFTAAPPTPGVSPHGRHGS